MPLWILSSFSVHVWYGSCKIPSRKAGRDRNSTSHRFILSGFGESFSGLPTIDSRILRQDSHGPQKGHVYPRVFRTGPGPNNMSHLTQFPSGALLKAAQRGPIGGHLQPCQESALPSSTRPSDHVSLVATFMFHDTPTEQEQANGDVKWACCVLEGLPKMASVSLSVSF